MARDLSRKRSHAVINQVEGHAESARVDQGHMRQWRRLATRSSRPERCPRNIPNTFFQQFCALITLAAALNGSA